jgi:hypothetical protein
VDILDCCSQLFSTRQQHCNILPAQNPSPSVGMHSQSAACVMYHRACHCCRAATATMTVALVDSDAEDAGAVTSPAKGAPAGPRVKQVTGVLNQNQMPVCKVLQTAYAPKSCVFEGFVSYPGTGTADWLCCGGIAHCMCPHICGLCACAGACGGTSTGTSSGSSSCSSHPGRWRRGHQPAVRQRGRGHARSPTTDGCRCHTRHLCGALLTWKQQQGVAASRAKYPCRDVHVILQCSSSTQPVRQQAAQAGGGVPVRLRLRDCHTHIVQAAACG